MVLYFFAALIPLTAASLASFTFSQGLLRSARSMFDSNLFLDSLSDAITNVDGSLREYLNSRNSDMLPLYYRDSFALQRNIAQLPDTITTNQHELSLRLLRQLLIRYQEEADAALNAKRGRLVPDYSDHYRLSLRLLDYIHLLVLNMNWVDFMGSLNEYLNFSQWFARIQLYEMILVATVALGGVLLIALLSYRLTRPIAVLADQAATIAHGEFSIPDFEPDGASSEVRRLAEAHNSMKHSIATFIDELKEKSAIERELMEQHIQNLRMKGLLNAAELMALQAQINPHFLYNTLNIGLQLAVVENARRTTDYLDRLAEVFRYTLSSVDKAVTLKEELDALSAYIYVMETRFGSRITFEVNASPDCADVRIPPLVIQPVVENAVHHGLSNLEKGGFVSVTAQHVNNQTRIEVKDNGSGIPPGRLDELLTHDFSAEGMDSAFKGRTSGHGIGLANVVHRLRLFFNRDDVVFIKCPSQGGTSVVFLLPLQPEKEMKHV